MSIDNRIIFYNNGEATIKPKIENLLANFHNLKNWPQTRTCEAMDRHGSNKNHRQHVIYTPFYDALFGDLTPQGILEFGIGSQNNAIPFSMNGQPCKVGGSIRAWQELYPTAKIFAADVDHDVLFNEDRIRSYFVNALDPKIVAEMWINLKSDFPDATIDIMIDDAHHSPDANLMLINYSIQHLAVNGWYSIEDINRNDEHHTDQIKDWLSNQKYDSVFLDIPNDTNGTNNCLAIIHKTSI